MFRQQRLQLRRKIEPILSVTLEVAKSTRRISDAITQAVFLPTPVAYLCLVVGYLRTGLALYSAFIIASYMAGLLKRVAEWPLISKITLACGPPLLGLGYFFSTETTTYAMYAPGLVYCALSLAGGLALRQLD